MVDVSDFDGWESLDRRLEKNYRISTQSLVRLLLTKPEGPIPPRVAAYIAQKLESNRPSGRPKDDAFERLRRRMVNPVYMAAVDAFHYKMEQKCRYGRTRNVMREAFERAALKYGVTAEQVRVEYRRHTWGSK